MRKTITILLYALLLGAFIILIVPHVIVTERDLIGYFSIFLRLASFNDEGILVFAGICIALFACPIIALFRWRKNKGIIVPLAINLVMVLLAQFFLLLFYLLNAMASSNSEYDYLEGPKETMDITYGMFSPAVVALITIVVLLLVALQKPKKK